MCEAVTDTSKSDSLAEYLLTGSFSGWLKKKKDQAMLGREFQRHSQVCSCWD